MKILHTAEYLNQIHELGPTFAGMTPDQIITELLHRIHYWMPDHGAAKAIEAEVWGALFLFEQTAAAGKLK